MRYVFKNEALLKTALTHKSYASECRLAPDQPKHNERMEFLGDAVLGIIITSILYERFPDFDEGKLSRMRSVLVKQGTLAGLARKNELGSKMLFGKGESITGPMSESILSSAYEAVVGAIYLDGGLVAANSIVDDFEHLLADIRNIAEKEDPKSSLQEKSQGLFGLMPKYTVLSINGPDHDQTFEIKVIVANMVAVGIGKNKKQAESEAAKILLENIEFNQKS